MAHIFDYSHLERKVFPTEEEKKERASNFDFSIANSAFEGYDVGEDHLALREAYIEGYLTAKDITRMTFEKMGLPYDG